MVEGLNMIIIIIIGPVAVGISVIDSFVNYKSGIYSDSSCNKLCSTNHAVVVVGEFLALKYN